MENIKEFGDFLNNTVNLNKRRIDTLEEHINGVGDWLKTHLDGFLRIDHQGSYALGTMIKPHPDRERYDADIQIVVMYDPDKDPKDYIDEVYEVLKTNKNYEDKVHRRTRGVEVNYSDGSHLDVVPRITIRENGEDVDYIFNRNENIKEKTDGAGYREWFNRKNRIAKRNLKRAVRILKHLRDVQNNYTAKSILLTTLAAREVYNGDENTGSFKSTPAALVTILSRMDKFLQNHPKMPTIENPALPGETFDRHWDQQKYDNFRQRMHENARKAREAYDAEDQETSIKLWQGLLGNDFGKSSGGRGTGGDNQPKQPQGPQNPTTRARNANPTPIAAAATGAVATPTPHRTGRPGEAAPFG